MSSELICVTGPGGAPLRIRVHGGGSGAPILYLHGAGGLLPDDPFVAALTANYQVHAPLLPGYEDSEGSDVLRTMLDFTLHTAEVAQALKLSRPLVIGHSMGGMIAAEWASVAPTEIDKLLLLAPAGLWLDEYPVADLFSTLPYELPELLFANPNRFGPLLSAGGDLNDPEFLTEFMVANARRMGTAGKLLFPVPDRGLSDRLHRVTAKTRVLWGEQDRVMDRAYADAFGKAIVGATVTLIGDAGHMLQYEQMDAVMDAVESLLG